MSIFILTDEEQAIVDKGEAAGFLLDSPLFLQAIEAVRERVAEAILCSDPGAVEARETNYHLARGLSEVTQALSAIAAEGQTIIANHQLREASDKSDGADRY